MRLVRHGIWGIWRMSFKPTAATMREKRGDLGGLIFTQDPPPPDLLVDRGRRTVRFHLQKTCYFGAKVAPRLKLGGMGSGPSKFCILPRREFSGVSHKAKLRLDAF